MSETKNPMVQNAIFLQTYEIQGNNKYFKYCIDILFRMIALQDFGCDSLESIRNEYISIILHTSFHIGI